MTTTKNIANPRMKDPSTLTQMEQKLHDLRQQGLTYAQIAEQMGGKWTEKNIGGKLKIIREKLACQ